MTSARTAAERIEWGREYLTAAAVEPNRALVLSYEGHGMEWVWQLGLHPCNLEHTRLVSRGTERTPNAASFWLFMQIMESASFVMTRKMLLNLKDRAERLHVCPAPAPRLPPPHRKQVRCRRTDT